MGFFSGVDVAAESVSMCPLEPFAIRIRESSSSISGGKVGESIGGKSHTAGFATLAGSALAGGTADVEFEDKRAFLAGGEWGGE